MKVIKCEFATESDLGRDDFKESLKGFHTKNWSRVWEYPFAALNSRLESDQEVLIAGCCGDELTDYFSQKMNVTGIDLLDCERNSFKFVEGDLRNMPFPDNSFDYVFCISVLEHLDSDPYEALMELVRVSKRRVIITVDYNRFKFARWNSDMVFASPFRFSPWDFDSFCRKMGIKTPELPDDVLKSEATESGKLCGAGLSVCGFVIEVG